MPTPTVKKLQLGNELRHLREAAGLSQAQAGKILEKVQSRIAGLERGQLGITPGDLLLLLRSYGVTDQERIDFFLDLRRDSQQRGRWTGYRSVFVEQFRMYVDLEEDASSLRAVQAEIPHGLLQCESFIRALYTGVLSNVKDRDIESQVQARLARQEILTKPDAPQLSFVLSESCLLRMYAAPEIMKKQLMHMVEVSRLPNVRLQILPFNTRSYRGSTAHHQFTLLRIPSPGMDGQLDFVYVEDVEDARYIDDKKLFTAHENMWSHFTAAALGFEDSRKFISEAAKNYQ